MLTSFALATFCLIYWAIVFTAFNGLALLSIMLYMLGIIIGYKRGQIIIGRNN